MSTKVEQVLYRIDRIVGKMMHIAGYGMLVLIAITCIRVLFVQFGIADDSVSPLVMSVYRYSWIICLTMVVLCAICRICLSPFVKSEEQEDFEQKVDYILAQKQTTNTQVLPADYTPLRNLSYEQVEIVKKMLRDIPNHPNKPNQIRMAEVACLLTALEKMGKANLSDKHALRLWVMQITNKQAPSSSHFNEALPYKNRKELASLCAELGRVFADNHT